MKNDLNFAQNARMLNGEKSASIINNKNILIVNRETLINNTILKDIEGKDLEFGSVIFDVPNITSYMDSIKKVMKTLKDKADVGESTYFYTASKEDHYYSEYELKGYRELDEIIKNEFSSEHFENFLKFPEIIREISLSVSIEQNHFHKLEAVERSSEIIYFVLNKIKEKNLSPYERFLAAYDFTTSTPYNQFGAAMTQDKYGNIIENYVSDNFLPGGKERDWRMSRTLTNILNTGHIVCVGYAKLLNIFCNELNISSTPETVKSLKQKEGEKDEWHRRLIVRMKDSKYGIDGIYKSDPTADYRINKDGLDSKRFLHHLVPLKNDFLNVESPFEELAKGNISKEDMYNNYLKSREILADINNNGIARKYNEVLITRKIVNHFKTSLENEEILNSLSDTYFIDLDTGGIELGFKENTELSEKSLEEYKVVNQSITFLVSENERKKEGVLLEFEKVNENTKDITPDQFKSALQQTLPIIKPSFAKDEDVARKYVQWLHDFNKEFALLVSLPNSTFGVVKKKKESVEEEKTNQIERGMV